MLDSEAARTLNQGLGFWCILFKKRHFEANNFSGTVTIVESYLTLREDNSRLYTYIYISIKMYIHTCMHTYRHSDRHTYTHSACISVQNPY